jgi:hypothetical protein
VTGFNLQLETEEHRLISSGPIELGQTAEKVSLPSLLVVSKFKAKQFEVLMIGK